MEPQSEKETSTPLPKDSDKPILHYQSGDFNVKIQLANPLLTLTALNEHSQKGARQKFHDDEIPKLTELTCLNTEFLYDLLKNAFSGSDDQVSAAVDSKGHIKCKVYHPLYKQELNFVIPLEEIELNESEKQQIHLDRLDQKVAYQEKLINELREEKKMKPVKLIPAFDRKSINSQYYTFSDDGTQITDNGTGGGTWRVIGINNIPTEKYYSVTFQFKNTASQHMFGLTTTKNLEQYPTNAQSYAGTHAFYYSLTNQVSAFQSNGKSRYVPYYNDGKPIRMVVNLLKWKVKFYQDAFVLAECELQEGEEYVPYAQICASGAFVKFV